MVFEQWGCFLPSAPWTFRQDGGYYRMAHLTKNLTHLPLHFSRYLLASGGHVTDIILTNDLEAESVGKQKKTRPWEEKAFDPLGIKM